MRAGLPLSLAIVLVLLPASADAAGLIPNPANHPSLLGEPIEDSRYDPARHCRKRPTDGAKAMIRWLERTVRGENWGINRCERLKRGSFSVHSEGRAIDWRRPVSR